MNPFALLNDVDLKVKNIILDKNLESVEFVAFHPIENNATVEFAKSEFDRFIQHCNRKLEVIKLEEVIFKIMFHRKKANKTNLLKKLLLK